MSRTAEIAKVMSKYGLDWLAHSRSPFRVLALPSQWFGKGEPTKSQPERVRLALEELGTTYIKLGQAVSTRTDLVPSAYIEELSKLQDDAPEIPFHDIREVIIEEFGIPPEELFTEFERQPMAAASIGQVHRARLADGTRVVVKVQRPGAQEQVEQDLVVMKDLVHALGGIRALDNYDLEGWLEEFSFTLLNELDYRREPRNAGRFRFNFADDPTLYIPLVYWEFTTRRVITMEEVGGVKITDVDELDRQGINRTIIAEDAARIILTEIFEYGLFHADPHAGNFFVEHQTKINLIDFGMVGTLDRWERESLMRITLAMSNRDVESLIDELLTIGYASSTLNRQVLKSELQRLLQIHLDAPAEEFSMATMFQDTLRTAAEYKIHIQSNLLFLARALAMCEGMGKVLDPNYRLMDTTRTHLERIYRKTHSPEALADRARENYIEIGDFALEFPKKIRRIFHQIETGDLVVTAKLGDTAELLEHFHRAVNRLSMAVLVAGVITGLSFLATRLGTAASFWINAMLMVVIGGGLILIISIWKSRKV